MSVVGFLVIIAVCLAASAFFSGSETALFRLRAHELDKEVERANGPAGVAVRELTASTSRLLVTILLGNNVVNILGAAVASALAIQFLGPRVGIPLATLIMTFLVLIFCEIFPKAVAARHPLGVARAVGLPLYILHQLLRPIHALFDRVIEPALRRITGGIEGEAPLSSEDVLRLARDARDGQEEGSPLAIIGATSAAAEMDVTEIMVQRTEMLAFPVDTPPAELLESVLDERYTRVPIYKEDIDDVLGIVHLKDVIKLVRTGGTDLQGVLKPVLRVPERKPILRLLADMQRSFSHMALVNDEFGVTLGLVTQEFLRGVGAGERSRFQPRIGLADSRRARRHHGRFVLQYLGTGGATGRPGRDSGLRAGLLRRVGRPDRVGAGDRAPQRDGGGGGLTAGSKLCSDPGAPGWAPVALARPVGWQCGRRLRSCASSRRSMKRWGVEAT